MLLNLVSFLLVFFQFFHSGTDRIRSVISGESSLTSVKQHFNFYSIDTHQTLRCTIDPDETEDTETKQVLKQSFIAPLARIVFLPSSESKNFPVYQEHSATRRTPLFVLHCNFRV